MIDILKRLAIGSLLFITLTAITVGVSYLIIEILFNLIGLYTLGVVGILYVFYWLGYRWLEFK